MQKLLLIITYIFVFSQVFAQKGSNIKTVFIPAQGDTIKLDTLSIIPGTIKLSDNNGNLIPDSAFTIDFANGILIKKNSFNRSGNIKAEFKSFPISFTKPFFKKDFRKLNTPQDNSVVQIYTPNKQKQSDFFDRDEITKRGSLSRGITFGNNQDVILNSNLNLQLSGRISENLELLAAITDNNIPIQPDGNSQQIQEFDKVFIQVFNKKMKLIVGDYEVNSPAGRYMNMLKKVQGAYFSGTYNTNTEKDRKIKTTASASIAKGKFHKTDIQGIEGVQGPYRLKGAENEAFIVIIAGTEKVYIDGKLLTRGQNNDYTIDYNLGEITFTTNQPVSKDKRIVAEYQYSDKNYARYMLFNSSEFSSGKNRFWVNVFMEQDSKNQPVNVTLTDDIKKIMANAGDSMLGAVVPKIDSVPFQNDAVLYSMTDTTVNGITFDSVFVYSVNPITAHYRLGFSYVGENNGNYIQTKSSANGRVFKWVAPVAGNKQGSYEPLILLVTPKKKQMITAGAEIIASKRTNLSFEFAATNNDQNTFSGKHKSDDAGYAFNIKAQQHILTDDTLEKKLRSSISYQLVTNNFDPVERFKTVEHNRDWNIAKTARQTTEQLLGLELLFYKNKFSTIRYNTDLVSRQNNSQGIKNSLLSDLIIKQFKAEIRASYLQTSDTFNKTNFLRHSVKLSWNHKYFTTGIKEESEKNIWNTKSQNLMLPNSFEYRLAEVFFASSDSIKNRINLSYNIRQDKLPYDNTLKFATESRDLALGFTSDKNANNIIKAGINFRQLKIADTLLSRNKPENNTSGRIDHSIRILKGFITATTFFELSTGLELKKEFVYLEVAQGQGVYSWSQSQDYNNNGIKDINEFEVAHFQDQANYIRVFVPSREYVKIISNQFSHSMQIRPDRIIKNNSVTKKILSRFSNNIAFNITTKDSKIDLQKALNPFDRAVNNSYLSDSSLQNLASSLRNVFSFNKSNPVFGIDYIFGNNRSRNLLMNGFDTRMIKSHGVHTRWNINQSISLQNNNDYSEKKYTSQYFVSKNYNIPAYSSEGILDIQFSMEYKVSLNYKYTYKHNSSGDEKLQSQIAGLELKYNAIGKGNLTCNFSYILNHYRDSFQTTNTNTPVAYEMLEGLMPGKNSTWGVQFQRNVNKVLQISVGYTGRISENSKAVHTGTMQVRASF